MQQISLIDVKTKNCFSTLNVLLHNITENDVICMQMTLFDISMHVFSWESAKTDQINKKIRSKSNVKQSNVDRIMRFLDKNINCVISLDKIDCLVDSQLIFEVDETIELKSR
jgi:hypothetical protein